MKLFAAAGLAFSLGLSTVAAQAQIYPSICIADKHPEDITYKSSTVKYLTEKPHIPSLEHLARIGHEQNMRVAKMMDIAPLHIVYRVTARGAFGKRPTKTYDDNCKTNIIEVPTTELEQANMPLAHELAHIYLGPAHEDSTFWEESYAVHYQEAVGHTMGNPNEHYPLLETLTMLLSMHDRPLPTLEQAATDTVLLGSQFRLERQIAYLTGGCFVKYLNMLPGVDFDAMMDIYKNGTFQKHTGRTLEELEQDFRHWFGIILAQREFERAPFPTQKQSARASGHGLL